MAEGEWVKAGGSAKGPRSKIRLRGEHLILRFCAKPDKGLRAEVTTGADGVWDKPIRAFV